MTDQEIKTITEVAKIISDITPSELVKRIPNNELRDAILDIYEQGFIEGQRFTKRTLHN